MPRGVSTKQIGDGKLPNKYWVSVSNDYYVCKDGVCDWASEYELIDTRAKTIAKFDTYRAAMRFIERNLYPGATREGIRVNNIDIEDRLSGNIYQQTYYFYPIELEIHERGHEDIKFTVDKLAEHGVKFE